MEEVEREEQSYLGQTVLWGAGVANNATEKRGYPKSKSLNLMH
jgi:hypothetical protein